MYDNPNSVYPTRYLPPFFVMIITNIKIPILVLPPT